MPRVRWNPVQLRPLGVEDVGQIRVEGIAVEEALLRVHAVLAHGLVDPGDAGHRRGDVRTEGTAIGDRFGGEEAPAEHFGHVLLLHRLDAFLPLPVEDVEDLLGQRLAERVALRGVGREQGGDQGAAIDLDHRLAERLEEADQPAAPVPRHRRLLAGVHQHLVDQDQGREPIRLRPRQQVREQRLGGRRLTLLVRAVGMERAQALVARDLEREHAPGMLQPAKLARRPAHFHAFLHVELVEAERGDARRRQGRADVGPELVHRGQGRQRLRVVDEMAQRHQRMGLAPAVGELELADGLGVPAGEAERHVARKLAQGEGRKGQREETARVLVDRSRAFLHDDVVKIGGEVGERELARAHVLAQLHDLVPGSPGEGLRHIRSRSMESEDDFETSVRLTR